MSTLLCNGIWLGRDSLGENRSLYLKEIQYLATIFTLTLKLPNYFLNNHNVLVQFN